MTEYNVTVTARVTKQYIIDANTNEEAMSLALEYFNDFTSGEDEIDFDNIDDLTVYIDYSSKINTQEYKD